jgi:hypothetical protein
MVDTRCDSTCIIVLQKLEASRYCRLEIEICYGGPTLIRSNPTNELSISRYLIVSTLEITQSTHCHWTKINSMELLPPLLRPHILAGPS